MQAIERWGRSARFGPTTPKNLRGLPLALRWPDQLQCCRTWLSSEPLSPSAGDHGPRRFAHFPAADQGLDPGIRGDLGGQKAHPVPKAPIEATNHGERPNDPRAWRQRNIKPVPGRSVALISCYHLCNKLPLGQRGRVNRLTGGRKAVRDHSMPAQVQSGGKPEPTRRLHRETRPARSRLDGFKPNPQRLISGPAATLATRRRAPGAGHKRPVGGKTARCSIRGREPVSRDEWAT